MRALTGRAVVRFVVAIGFSFGAVAANATYPPDTNAVLWGSSSEGTNPSSIFRIDAATGAATLVGPSGLGDKISAVAVDPETGTLYGIRGSACTGARLVRFDQETGVATVIGIVQGEGFDGTNDTGGGTNDSGESCFGGADALTFGADGTLYAGGWNGGTAGGKILTLDKSNGQVLANHATDVVSESALPAHLAGLATASDGTLWVSRGNNTAGTIHTIDPATGHFTSTVALSDVEAVVSDLAFTEDGTLYGAMPKVGKLVTIATGGDNAGQIHIVGQFGNGEKIAGLALLGVEVAAADCADAEGCNPTGGQVIQLPDNVSTDGATITQKQFLITDPRVATGRCGKDTLVLFGDDPNVPDLIIPEYLCGSPEFVVLKTESNLLFQDGTLIATNLPENFFGDNALSCDSPIVGDPQQQDVMVWQTTNSSDLEEGHALELTFQCGSSRGRTRGLSYFVVGMHIDFGLDWNTDPEAVRQAFIDLTSVKFHGLLRAIVDARRVLPRRDFRRLVIIAGIANLFHHFGRYEHATREMSVVIALLDRAQFDTSGDFNHRGNVAMRAYNVKFMLDEKVINLMN